MKLETPNVLVLGMHRSGTSALAAMLMACGLRPPGATVRNWDNPRGHHEAVEAVRLNEELLALGGGHQHRAPGTLRWDGSHEQRRDALLAHPGSLIKDPRLLLTWPFWQEAPARRIAIVRHPAAVAASLQAWRGMAADEALSSWIAHNRVLIPLIGGGLPVVGASDPDLPGRVADIAAGWGLPADPTAVQSAFIADDLHGDDAMPEDADRRLAAEALALWRVFALPHAPTATPEHGPRALIVAITRAKAAGDLALAQRLADAADGPVAALWRGKLLLERHQPAAAIAHLGAAGDLHEARHLLAHALHATGDPGADAALLATVPTAIHPHRPLATLAEWSHQRGDRAQAIARMDAAIAAAPLHRRGRLRCRLAEWLDAVGERERAMQEARLAQSEDPGYPRSGEILARWTDR